MSSDNPASHVTDALSVALRVSESRYRRLFETAQDGILLLNADTAQIEDVNPYLIDLLGYSHAEFLGKKLWEVGAFSDRIESKEMFVQLQEIGYVSFDDLPLKTKSGAKIAVEFVSNTYDCEGIKVIQCNIRNINQRKKAQMALHESESKYRQLLEGIPDLIYSFSSKRGGIFYSPSVETILGYSVHYLLAHPFLWQELIHPSDVDAVKLAIQKLKSNEPIEIEYRIKDSQGKWHWLNDRSIGTRQEDDESIIEGIATDITERKQSDVILRKSKDLLKSVVENVPIRVFWKDRDLQYLGCNTLFAEDAGYNKPAELIGKTDFEMVWKGQAEMYRADDQAVIDSGNPKLNFVEAQAAPDGNTIWLRTSKVPMHDEHNQAIGILGIYEDITKHRQAEISLIKSNRALAALGAVSRSLVHSTKEPELLSAVCQAIVSQSNYRMAWVGYLEYDEAKTIRVVAFDGVEEGYLESAAIVWSDTVRGLGPSGKAARSGETQVAQNLLNDKLLETWWKDAAKRGYAASISFPLIQDGKVFGVLNIYSGYIDAFGEEEVSLLEQMAADLAFGIVSIRTRQERDHALEKIKEQLAKLESNLEDTVEAISTIVEFRDPYTAGHQQRVAELAVTIAREMGLPDDQIKGIHLGGIVHDLGKIQIPAEILAMPRRLNAIEYKLVQFHPQSGYDILKDIDFPWPIAQMVLQHHERLDGSGYPFGLKGEAIMLEARILCVADVVEAMASHRPYRPSLGTDAALDEIKRGRGTIYDPHVVDACLKVFAAGNFKL